MGTKKVVLVGAGRFGILYLHKLLQLQESGQVELMAVVVQSPESAARIAAEYHVHTATDLTSEILQNCDQFFVVTPPETHFEIAKTCIQYADTFVEKPLSYESDEIVCLQQLAMKSGTNITVGHLFRFHPLTKALKETAVELLREDELVSIEGVFINAESSDQGRVATHELLHLFDITDYVLESVADVVFVNEKGRVTRVDVRYGNGIDASYYLGWQGSDKQRTMTLRFRSGISLCADYIANTYSKKSQDDDVVRQFENSDILLEQIIAVLDKSGTLADPTIAKRIHQIAATPAQNKKVAVIGGGIFGVNTAIQLQNAEVTLFEKNKEIMQEGAYINQFRHHMGYHYPRSDETVNDVKNSRSAFEAIFGDALVSNPTYYAVAREGSLVTDEQFLSFCDKHELPYKVVQDHDFNEAAVSTCIEVPEPSYHYEKLYELANEKLAEAAVNVQVNQEVIGAELLQNGQKKLTFVDEAGNEKCEVFDYVINTTYARLNAVAVQLGFAPLPIRVDVAEVLIVSIPIDPISLTVMDGPFATLMPTGNEHEFTLYHVTESILDRYNPDDGLVKNKTYVSNEAAILEKSKTYFPQLADATVKESRIVLRGVQANREHDDNRVAELIDHGFGCWSVLSGKILSSAKIAKHINDEINLRA